MPKSLASLSLLCTLALAAPFALHGDDIWQTEDIKSLSSYDGKETFDLLEIARLKKAPTWEAGVDKRPPVSAEEAYATAKKELESTVKTPKEWDCAHLSLQRAGEKVWYWEVQFFPKHEVNERDGFHVVVYLDGTVGKRIKAVFR